MYVGKIHHRLVLFCSLLSTFYFLIRNFTRISNEPDQPHHFIILSTFYPSPFPLLPFPLLFLLLFELLK
ncbi:hypothetical protein I7I53_01571 [Histoplasma capsulatum var. duboisii H88]|uniref:Uncharacterized protein n=1 Tax=Ajellomyces capsulatus (strain H88) TaxID=544711 RepID=A0A8A1LI96_AJEC8|nr:hypothetical protein I7I53_01571 [Histoplasma capsulatum var. duboisii H88]